MMKSVLLMIGLLTFSIIVPTYSAQAEQMALVYHGINVVESPTQFAGIVMHFMVNGDKATVVISGQKGMEIIRMNVKPSDSCIQTQSTLCFDGTVTSVKNSQIHQIGDNVSLTLDLANKKQIDTVKSGAMQGTTVTMNIQRTSIQSDSPYAISVSREGGFAALPPKTVAFDSSTGILVTTDKNSNSTNTLDSDAISQINSLVHKAKLLNIMPEQYVPHQGAADYFTYHMTLNQGIFQKEFTWTDASDAPKSLSEISQSLMHFAQPDN